MDGFAKKISAMTIKSSDQVMKSIRSNRANISIKTSKSYFHLKEVTSQASRLTLTEHVIMAPNQKHKP